MSNVILATSNPGKIIELQPLLSPLECIAQSTLGIQPIEETGLSFIENALLKARHASEISKLPALADDSGLVVPILNGQPGIYSARYAGPNATDKNNIECLLSNLTTYSGENRRAYFYCAIAMVKNAADPTPLIAVGQCFGEILHTPRGNHGFGYDPIFYVPEYQQTFAELSKEIKNTISHRAQALKQLTQQFQTQLIDYTLKTSVS